MNTQDWLAARSKISPNTIGLIIGDREWRYAELNALVDDLAGRLHAAGTQPGEKIAALLPNGLEYVCLLHALARLGCVLVPLNSRLTVSELNWQLDKTGARWLVCAAATETLAAALATTGRTIISVDDSRNPAVVSLAAMSPTAVPPHPFRLEALQAIIFTSGTSGRPKGAMLTFANHLWSATASAFHLGTQPGDRWLSCLPLYHVGGLAVLFRSCLYGTTAVLQDGFNVTAVNHSLDRQQITMVSLVPTMLYRLLAARNERSWPAALRLVLLGGAAAPADLIQQCAARGIPVATTYGLTEAASQVATMRPNEVARKPGSVGKPLLFTTVSIVGDDGRELPPGDYGEIVVAGPTVMIGYYGDETTTAVALRDGRLYTGDIGYLDDDGDLWLVQRRSDLIISGGENVYPAEVEAVLRRHPAVAAVCVVGVADPEWGQRVAAAVVRRPGTTATAEELIAFSRQHLAGYKLPREIRFAADLPQTGSGKIQRHGVAQLLAAGSLPENASNDDH